MFKVHIKLTIVNNKPLCEYTPPLASFDKMLKDVLHSSVKIGSGIKPVNIDILQPPEKSEAERDERGHFYFKNESAIEVSEAYVQNRIRTICAMLRGIWDTSKFCHFAPNISRVFL